MLMGTWESGKGRGFQYVDPNGKPVAVYDYREHLLSMEGHEDVACLMHDAKGMIEDRLREAFDAEYVTLTGEMIHGAGTRNGVGWTREQLSIMGVSWPPRKGWLKGMVGKTITRKQWNKFVASGKD